MKSNNQREARKDLTRVHRLLDREAPDGYLSEWTKRIGAQITAPEAESHSVFIFRIGAEWLALPAHVLNEVSQRNPIHSIPHRRGGVLSGLTCVRGELVLCISLETLLGLEEAEGYDQKGGKASGRILVISHDGGLVAFPVSEIYGFHRYHTGELQALPDTVSKEGSCMVGLLPWRDKNVGCLHEDLLFHALLGELS